MKASRSANAGMIVADRGLSLVAAAVVRVAIVAAPVRVVLVVRGVISAGLVEEPAGLTKIAVAPAAEEDFADRSLVVAEAARRSDGTIIAIVHSVRPSSRGRWW